MNNPKLSICLVNWNTADDLRECLRSLQEFPYTSGDTEVLVVDNASSDGSAEMVRGEFTVVRLIQNAANEIYARGVNQCLEAATGDLLLLLNPDVQATVGALDALVSEIENAPVMAGRLVFPNGETQKSVRGFPDPVPLLLDMLQLWRLFPHHRNISAYRLPRFDYDKAAEGDFQPMASCLLFTREVYETVGGMDERFPLFFNDADFCLRVRRAGFAIRYTPRAVFLHKGGATTKRVRRAAVWESHRALLRFYKKHYEQNTSVLLYHIISILVTLGAWARARRLGESLGRDGGETTPADLRRELEREG